MKREDVYAALFALLQPLVGNKASGKPFRLASRRLQFVEDVDANSCPSIFQLQVEEAPAFNTFGGFAGWHLVVDWYIYVAFSDETSPSSPLFNPLVDAVSSVLPNEQTQIQLLVDGQAIGVSLRDKIRPYEGLLNNKAVVVIPLLLLVPDALTGE